jgi:hypothetical protein
MIEKILARYRPVEVNYTTPSTNINTWTIAQSEAAPGVNISAVNPP